MKLSGLAISRVYNSSLIRNSGWNFAGQIVPFVVALFSIPFLVTNLGDEKYGFLNIAWLLIGYFSLFDFGIGRALTYGISVLLSAKRRNEVSNLVWTGMLVLSLAGCAVGMVLFLSSQWLVDGVLKLSDSLKHDATVSLYILSIGVPFVTLSAGLRGILEAHKEFKSINALMMFVGPLIYLCPVAVTFFSDSLVYLLSSLVSARAAIFLSLFLLCVKRIENFLRFNISFGSLKNLLGFGGWITVTNIVSPVMHNMDRLFISTMMSVSSLTYYTIPFDVVSRLTIIPSSVAGVVYPEFSRFSEQVQNCDATRYFVKAYLLVFFAMLPVVISLILASDYILTIWISEKLAEQAALIMKLLAIGFLINGISYIPYSYIQGMGRADITAKFHVFELVLYLPSLYLMILYFGLVGAALTWVFRALVDSVLLHLYAVKTLKFK